MSKLPDHITTETIRNTSDLIDKTHDTGIIDEVMEPYIDLVVEELTTRLHLTAEQTEELTNRIGWRLELLPPQP